ncbi:MULTISPECIES: aldo/keto reductase [unclassified Streptomyces]|uniref:aldo/keto reductase n=1 Tax=unclassified Streptomyces TaxID=2593676 RepID=UPI002E1846EA|nr:MULTISPECIES: aldo/keto reductase [unclassified Streptomyces]
MDGSLQRLKLDRIDLYQLHRIDPRVPLAEQVGVLAQLREEGKIRHVGLSEVTVEELVETQQYVPIVSVQNLFNLDERKSEAVLEHCEREGIAFIPWFPLATGQRAGQFGSASEPEVIALSVWGAAHGLVSLVLSGNEPPGLAVADCFERALRALVKGWRDSEDPVAGFAEAT